MRIKEALATILKTKTLNHFLITSGGTAINGLLGLLFYIVVARNLGPEVYGILAIAIATITLLSDIADFGIDTAVLRFVGKYRHQDKVMALRFIKLGLEVKLLVWVAILLGGWLLVPTVAQLVFLKPELVVPLRFALIGVGGALLFSLASHIIQAWEKFWLWSFINIGMNGLRLLAVFALLFLGSYNLSSVLSVYIAVPFLGFFLALLFLPNFLKVKKEREVSREFLHYGKWVALVGILTASGSRLDTFISARLLTVGEVGIYSAAVQLSIVVPQLVFALATVVAPKLASLNNDQKALAYLKKLQLLVTVMCVMGVILSPLSFWVIPAIYGFAYTDSVLPFIILFSAQLIFLLALPAHQAIYYYFSKPRIFSWIAVGQLLITALGGWVLISNWGIVGAAITVLLNNLFGFIIPAIWVVWQFKKTTFAKASVAEGRYG